MQIQVSVVKKKRKQQLHLICFKTQCLELLTRVSVVYVIKLVIVLFFLLNILTYVIASHKRFHWFALRYFLIQY